MDIKVCSDRTPSDLSKALKRIELKNFETFAEKNQRFLQHPYRIFRGIDWEPETPESTLPSYIAVKRSIKFDRKEMESPEIFQKDSISSSGDSFIDYGTSAFCSPRTVFR